MQLDQLLRISDALTHQTHDTEVERLLHGPAVGQGLVELGGEGDGVVVLGLLHDIGKINVPDAILGKPGKLTEEEFDILKRHPVVGYDVLKNLHMLTDELVIVRSHHERFDGRGYPDGKKGDELAIIAWIVAAADAFDAMTSDRPYRKGMSIEVALAEIAKCRGSQFHPAVADAVLKAHQKGDFKIIPQVSLFIDAPVVGAFENPTA